LNFPEGTALQRQALIGTGLILFVISLAVNLVARIIITRTGPEAKTRRAKKRIQQLPPSDPSSVLAIDDIVGARHHAESEGTARA
jgi:phosphate transport system permease protein